MSYVLGEHGQVERNRAEFFEKLNILKESVAVMEVEHGEQIVVLDRYQPQVVAEACMTNKKNLYLFLLTADCLPVAFFDPRNQVIALAHVGWKPTNAHLVSKVIFKMQEMFNSKPEDMLVSIGPSIHKESYAVVNPLQKTSPEWKPFLLDTSSGETLIDLIGFNRLQLKEAGVLEQNINISEIDTAVSRNQFSHHRSVQTGEIEGRFATVFGLRS